MPVNLAAGAAWDPAAFEEASRTVAAELAASGVHLALVSALDVLRDGRWGRSEETFGEDPMRSEEHTSELQSRGHLVCRLLLEKKKNEKINYDTRHTTKAY